MSRERRRQNVRHVERLLPQLFSALREAAGIYNQGASYKVHVNGESGEHPLRSFDLVIDTEGYQFEDTGQGYVRVRQLGTGQPCEVAHLHPWLDPHGEVQGWHEVPRAAGGREISRTARSLSDAYLMSTVRRHLVTRSTGRDSKSHRSDSNR